MLGRAGRGLPEALDRRERRGVVLIVSDRFDLTRQGELAQKRLTVAGSIRSYSACVPMNLMNTIPAEI